MHDDVVTRPFAKIPIGELLDVRVNAQVPSIGFFEVSSDCNHKIPGAFEMAIGCNRFRCKGAVRTLIVTHEGDTRHPLF